MTSTFKRSIHRTVTYFEESATITSKSYSWKRVLRHKVWLECGHVVFRGGMGSKAPTTKLKCERCVKGEPTKSLEGIEPGAVDKTRKAKVQDPIAASIMPGGVCE